MKRFWVLVLMMLCWLSPAMASISNFKINQPTEGSAGEIKVNVEAEYCTGCNPNTTGAPGHAAFDHGAPPPYTNANCPVSPMPDGTYIAARLTDGSGNVYSTQKIVLQQGSNLQRGTVNNWDFVFTGLSLAAGDTVTVEADLYCSWCGHAYPAAATYTIISQNVNVAPDTSGAYASPNCLESPPDHELVPIDIMGVVDPDGDQIDITINSITSDECVQSGPSPDAFVNSLQLRNERYGRNGRVYVINFTATDSEDNVSDGSVKVVVPFGPRNNCTAVDDGQVYDATGIGPDC